MATSKLNQFLEDIDQKVLECVICFKRLQNPKSLNCQHSFCLVCLEDWVKKKGKLNCPTCTQTYPIPEGGLQMLPPNTFLNNLLETLEQYDKPTRDHITKCVCGKAEEYYCQDCRHYLCCSCTDYHKMMPISANHKLHTVEDVRSMSPQDFTLLNPPLCSLHSKPLEFYCQDCKTPICFHCTLIEHKEEKDKTISISDAFQTFKETAEKLEERAHHYENKLQEALKAVIDNGTKLEESRNTCLKDIDNHVKVITKKIKENGNEMKNKVETLYIKRKQVNDVQMDELRTIISDVNAKLSFLKQLYLKSDEATAMQSSESVITALEDRVNEMPKTEPKDNGQMFFFANQHHIASMQQCDIGNVTKSMTDGLTINRVESVTQGQVFVGKIIKADRCNIEANELTATWTHPTGETNISQVDEDDNGDYVVNIGKCTRLGVYRLDVSFDEDSIKQSPMIIKVEQENTIKLGKERNDDDDGDDDDDDDDYSALVKCEDDCFLVACSTNEIHMYKQSEYIGKVTLPEGVEIFRMYKMKNGNIAVGDESNKCFKIVTMNGEVIKSIGQGILEDPTGIHMDEASNVVYVADWDNECVFKFDIDSGQMIRKMMSPDNNRGFIDVTLTNEGNILALQRDYEESCNNNLLQFDNEGRFMRVLIKGDEHSFLGFQEVVVDEDDNIVLLGDFTLLLFSCDGMFIKRIDKPEDRISRCCGVCLISQHPRKVALVNNGDKTIKIYDY